MPERTFYIAYGTLGWPATFKNSDPGQMFIVRRAAMAVARAGSEAYTKASDEQGAEVYRAIGLRFLEAPVGELMFGLTVEIELHDVVRFIAVTRADAKWEDNPSVERFHEGLTVDQIKRRTAVGGSFTPSFIPSSHGEPRPFGGPAPRKSRAEVIADKMAKATKEAVDNG